MQEQNTQGTSVNAAAPAPAPAPEVGAIPSVNSRGGTSGNAFAKVVFILVCVTILGVGGLIAYNKMHAASKAKDAETAKMAKAENSSAAVGRRRTFDDTPPPLPANANKGSGTANDPQCPDGGKPLFGPDGKPLNAQDGRQMRVCDDGKVFVPAVQPRAAEGAPAPIGTTAANGKAGQNAQGATPPSRFGGDVMVDPAGGKTQQTPDKATSQLAALAELMKISGATGGGGVGVGGAQSQGAGQGSGGGSGGRDGQGGALGGMLTGTQTSSVQATKLGDRSMILPKGKTIDCGLSIRLVSEIAGMATCVLTADVYSDDGRTLLLEKGSEAQGEYGSLVQQGQRRIFVLWTRVKTPNGITIAINSPAADALGTSGLDGYVDNHWPERIGAAFLLSLVQDVVAYEIAKVSGGNSGTTILQNTTQTGNQMAAKILDSTINIKPTLYKNQGDRATIFVARDLDFGSVYALRSR